MFRVLVFRRSGVPAFQRSISYHKPIFHPQFCSSVRCKQYGRQQKWRAVEKSAKVLDIKGDLVADSVIKKCRERRGKVFLACREERKDKCLCLVDSQKNFPLMTARILISIQAKTKRMRVLHAPCQVSF